VNDTEKLNTEVKITASDIADVCDGILQSAKEKLRAASKEDLQGYWYFKWNDEWTIQYNLYHFFDMLDLYQRTCRDWETMHNGYVCVVERVRDQYLMPKIREMLDKLAEVQGLAKLKAENKKALDIRYALGIAVSALYFGDSSNYRSALWNIVQELGGEEVISLLEHNAKAAFDKYAGEETT
jgi:hypothetical protein